MKRTSLSMALLALVVVGLVSLIPVAGAFVIGPLVALALGAIAGWWAAQRGQAGSLVPGARAAIITGLGALLGVVIAYTIVALVLGSDPGVQAFVRNSEPNPQARIPAEWIAPLGAAVGFVAGVLVGIFDLVASVIGGLVAALIYRNQHPQAT